MTTLYRPVGEAEYALIKMSGMAKFPPRLDWQPIFYPVTNQDYACQIALNWNAKKENEHVGYVLEFDVDDEFLAQYETHQVGGDIHTEYWIPAEDLDAFNAALTSEIYVVDVFEYNPKSDRVKFVSRFRNGDLKYKGEANG